ncbi:MAG: AAA family ATPase [Phycisphaerae bacterium]
MIRNEHFLASMSALHGAALSVERGEVLAPAPFVTISRQAGAGGRMLARRLVERLNQADPSSADRPWTCWDHELVERAAAEHHLSVAAIERLAGPPTPWLQQMFRGLAGAEHPADPDEAVVYHKVALTIRGLAAIGRCVIVGRGGVCATDDLPGGVHVRLVAPLAWRVAQMARVLHVSDREAAAAVARIDHDRQAFYRRYWPNKPFTPERFTIGFNTAAVSDVNRMANCILPLVGAPLPPAAALINPEPGATPAGELTE